MEFETAAKRTKQTHQHHFEVKIRHWWPKAKVPFEILPSFAVESESSRLTPPMGTLEPEACQKSQHLHLGFHISCGDGFLV